MDELAPDLSFNLTSEQLAYVCLALTHGIGPKTIANIQHAGLTASQVFELDAEYLKALGLKQAAQKSLKAHSPAKPNKEVEAALKWAQLPNHHLVTLSHPNYPEPLKNIDTPPPLLMVKGQLSALALNQIAIVGSRYPTVSGKEAAYEFAQELSHHGLCITSGLALGIDGAAHQGALDAGGATLAVLGTGLNSIYPKQHKKLAEAICDKGALISEFSLNAKGKAGHFPRRNRIVSGMSLGCLVVEATLKSGSLITARQALEQNREVMAVPGSVSNPQKAGCHHLVRQGAVLVETPEQVLQELALLTKPVTTTKQQKIDMMSQVEDPKQRNILKALDYDGRYVDELVSTTGLDVGELSTLLMGLELQGLVRQQDGCFSLL